MRLVSPLLKRVVYPALHRAGWISRNRLLHACAVVNYHGVVPSGYTQDDFVDGNLVPRHRLQQQLRFLKTHYHIITPEQFRAWIEFGEELPPLAVLITCDDGLLNTLTDMLPVLAGEDVPCLFLVTGASCTEDPGMLWYEELYHYLRAAHRLGVELELRSRGGVTHRFSGNPKAVWWDAVGKASALNRDARAHWMLELRNRLSHAPLLPERRWRLLNVHELKQLASAGMTIGAHTGTHPVLSLSSDPDARTEIEQSKAELERVLGRRVWAFAYPFGNPQTIGAREIDFARQAGFVCAFMNIGGGPADRSEPFTLPRTHITADMNLGQFEAHLTGLHTRLQRAFRG